MPPRPYSKLSLQMILVVPFALQIFGTVGVVAFLSFRNGQQTVHDLSEQLILKTQQQVDAHLSDLLNLPLQIAQMNQQAIERGDLDIQDQRASERYFWRQAQAFEQLTYVGYALTDGREVGAGRWLAGLGVTLYENLPGDNSASDYLADSEGNRTQKIQTYDYDVLGEDWYQDAVAAGSLKWTRIYAAENLSIEQTVLGQSLAAKQTVDLETGVTDYVAIAAAAPFYDRNNQLLGAICVDLLLADISTFLRSLQVSQSGEVFIFDREGLLVGSSSPEPILHRTNGEVQRFGWFDSPDPLIQSVGQQLIAEFHTLQAIEIPQQFSFRWNGERQLVKVSPWQDDYGLDWLVVIVVPQSDFMAQINANTRTTILLSLLALSVAVGMGLLTARWFTYPILSMVGAADALSLGHWNQQVPDSHVNELDRLSDAFNRMAVQLHDSFTKLEYIANHDSLTGLLNRRTFCLKLQTAIAEQTPTSSSFAVFFLDLDYFKLINDSYGHVVGDQLLLAVAERLQACLHPTDVLARFGGDEFVVLVQNMSHRGDAVRIAQRMLDQIQHPFDLGGREAFVSVSIGIVLNQDGKAQAEDFLRDADIALYQAKASGKARYAVFDATMFTNTVERLQLETDLRRALEREELQVYYQPIVSTATQQLIGFEALARWHHPSQGMISPARFIPIAEETGLIHLLGWWVMRQACQQIYQWQQQFPEYASLSLSVNLSTQQLLQSDFLHQVEQVLQATSLNPAHLNLEITESGFIAHEDITREKLHQLEHIGIRMSIDDFGTGYSSLSYLYRLPVHTLKIDRSFIKRLDLPGKNFEIVEAIVVLAHKLGIKIVAEGVETVTQLNQLQAIGCEYAQGYLFSKPLPAHQIRQLLHCGLAASSVARFPNAGA
ncbi:bifunctional diguanylate cyclase/phosphodiesterase [Egbenema bharatensis]|uniref:bifunctional diguanylate cyclase/phosphodiesterase n=1 Tax=Egbenema bharatensis TaxID=3463334 RepID=UPI003A868AED